VGTQSSVLSLEDRGILNFWKYNATLYKNCTTSTFNMLLNAIIIFIPVTSKKELVGGQVKTH
jgi:hypothetical protein